MEEPAAEFASSLRDLTTNSKPLISMLTMLADESRDHAEKIVEAIEHYLRTSESSIKLPSLYLIDSIVKNIGDPYVQLFTENIVRNFVLVFQEGDERVRTALFKLRQTWKEIFPERKLYALDLNTQAVDPNWPVCAAAPIHVNPKFFKKPPSELEIARGTESELKSLDERQKQLDRIQEELRRKRDEIAHKTAAAALVKQSQPETGEATPSLQSSLNGQSASQLQQHPKQLQQQELGEIQVAPKQSMTTRSLTFDKPNENHDNKDGESKKLKRLRDRDKVKKGAATEKLHNISVTTTSNNKTNSNDNKAKDSLAMVIGDTRRKEEERHKILSSKFRIPKKSLTSLTTSHNAVEITEEAKLWSDSARRVPSKRSSNSKRLHTSSHILSGQQQPTSITARQILADKEAATMLTGDIDLRVLEPRAKRRKEECIVFPSCKEDTDLRIRPKGAISFSAQALVLNAKESPREKTEALDVGPADATTVITEAHGRSRNDDIQISTSHASKRVSGPAPEFGQILLDRQMRDIRFVDGVAVAIMDDAPPNLVRARLVCFRGNPRPVVINEHQCVMASFDGEDHEFTVNGNTHRVRFGAPLRELYIDGVPYSCQFDGRPIKVRSGDDVFLITLPPPCPTVCDKRQPGPELVAKLGLQSLPTLGPMPGHVGSSGGLVGVPQGSSGGAGAAENGPISSARGVSGGWVRYQEEQEPVSLHAASPPSVRPIPTMFPPPMPPNISCPLPSRPSRFPMGPPCASPVASSGPIGVFHPHHTFGCSQMMPPPITGALDSLGGASVPPQSPAFPSVQRILPVNTQHGTALSSTAHLDVSDLLSKLVEQGLISNASVTIRDSDSTGSDIKKENGKKLVNSDEQSNTKKDKASASEEILPLSFKQPALLKQRVENVISDLHEGIQCSSCGQRFQQGDKSTSDKYAQHLDWHFRLKRRGREGLRKATSRKWFFGIADWIEFEEIEDLDERARNFFEEQEAQQESNSQDGSGVLLSLVQESPSVEVAKLPEGIVYSCEHCHESFEKFFCEDSEDWRLRNAVLVENKLFHPVCHEDYLKPVLKPVPTTVFCSDEDVFEETSQAKTSGSTIVTGEVTSDPTRTTLDEASQPLPGLDFDPFVETDENDVKKLACDGNLAHDDEPDSAEVKIDHPSVDEKFNENIQEDDANDASRADEQSVVVEELGEFGVDMRTESVSVNGPNVTEDANNTSTDGICTFRQVPCTDDLKDIECEKSKAETKVVVKGSGGFVLKVKQDSVHPVNNIDQLPSSGTNIKLVDELGLNEDADMDGGDDDDYDDGWRPPSPDPRFRSLPPLQKGSEMSGLCSIM
ncbi:hypothetical protein BIW11_02094 [Tropilaelaps mercedesae]|uniref:Pre-mRNA cleavage complex 2 protein Pcf11-like n=1 Tax=Tropilaelaps mercedesae TaxID=418985 RepID=A0A1V9X337_9ACAR|nr:hypothetical protein BIW11_02094 [Tropilaelaps mercedesae]